MRAERLVSMANDIGNFFDTEADKREAAKNIASHLTRFWNPRMRREIIAHYQRGGSGLNPVVSSAVGLLAEAEATTQRDNLSR